MFSWYHWLIVVVPVLAVCIAAVRCRKYVRSVTDFLVAGRCAGRYAWLPADFRDGRLEIAWHDTFPPAAE